MEDLLEAVCTLVLLTAVIVSGFLAVSSVLAWMIGLFQGNFAVIVGGLPMVAFFVAFSRLCWRLI